MRTLLALSLTAAALASPAAAQSSMDRYGYGPAPQAAHRPAMQQPDRHFLNWANKAEASSSNDSQDQQDERVSSYQAFQPQAPYRAPEPQRYAALVEPPPRAYSPPAYIAPPQVRPEPEAQLAPPRLELAGGPPEQAPSQRVAPVRPMPQAAAGPNGQARYYSLHREYGLTPDAIPEQQLGNNYVLIGPSAGLGKDPETDGEKAEKPF